MNTSQSAEIVLGPQNEAAIALNNAVTPASTKPLFVAFGVEFYQAVTAEGLMPVIGCEFYVVEDHHRKQFTKDVKDKRFHQLLLQS